MFVSRKYFSKKERLRNSTNIAYALAQKNQRTRRVTVVVNRSALDQIPN